MNNKKCRKIHLDFCDELPRKVYCLVRFCPWHSPENIRIVATYRCKLFCKLRRDILNKEAESTYTGYTYACITQTVKDI